MSKGRKWSVLHSSKKQDYETPDELFRYLDSQLGPFGMDVCASSNNTKCPLYNSEIFHDGLTVAWGAFSKKCWMNPPYRDAGKWLAKAYDESRKDCRVCCLVASRTGTKAWRDYCSKAWRIIFITGRIIFKGATNPAPFDSAVVVFDPCSQTPIIEWMNLKDMVVK